MTRVAWSTLEPGLTELLLGVTLCREYPSTHLSKGRWHRRPRTESLIETVRLTPPPIEEK